ncbi:MAG: hypothetical protein ACFFEU_11450 [Candidatus Thorarchaeota archaeon]
MRERNEGRCKWCGLSIQEWITPISKEGYCSASCRYARNAELFLLLGLFILFLSAVLFIVSFLSSAYSAIMAAFWGFTGAFIGVAVSAFSLLGYRHRRRVPFASRKDEVQKQRSEEGRDLIIRRVTVASSCPICGSNLDTSRPAPDGKVHCEYCGSLVEVEH